MQQLTNAASESSHNNHVCLSCRQALSRRAYASAATAQATVEAPPTSQITPNEPGVSPLPQPQFTLKAGIVLSRPPIITPDPHPFEKAYYLYQRRLNERLVLPFTQYFYYKRGTPAFEHWRTKRRERGGAATRDIGKYNAYEKEGWNDEVLVGDQTAEPSRIVEQLIQEEGRAAEYAGEGGNLKMGGLRRATDADTKNDQRSLERSLSRTLYLLVKSRNAKNDYWTLPDGTLEAKESLKEVSALNQHVYHTLT